MRFQARRYAIVLTFVGVILAAGVHRFGDPSPIARLVRGDGQEGLALALRSSTRALPMMTIGLGLGAGALIDTLPARIGARRRNLIRILAAAAVVAVAVGNNPSLGRARLRRPGART